MLLHQGGRRGIVVSSLSGVVVIVIIVISVLGLLGERGREFNVGNVLFFRILFPTLGFFSFFYWVEASLGLFFYLDHLFFFFLAQYHMNTWAKFSGAPWTYFRKK